MWFIGGFGGSEELESENALSVVCGSLGAGGRAQYFDGDCQGESSGKVSDLGGEELASLQRKVSGHVERQEVEGMMTRRRKDGGGLHI